MENCGGKDLFCEPMNTEKKCQRQTLDSLLDEWDAGELAAGDVAILILDLQFLAATYLGRVIILIAIIA